jgi:glyoxalase family protein
MKVKGIHHVTAITGDIQRNLDFYVGILGLRLAKRSVIQEEPSTYHLFYGDAVGSVGTGLTFFDWPHVGHDRAGARNAVRTLLSVAGDAALWWWSDRFDKLGIGYKPEQDFAGRNVLHFTDPEGQRLGLVAAGPFADYQHWNKNAAPPTRAIQAIHSMTLGAATDQLEPMQDFLTQLLGYEVTGNFRSDQENEGQGIALQVGEGGGVGKELVIVERVDPQPGLRGIGSIHHIALTVGSEETIEAWHERIVATGLKVSAIIRRHYFDSLYVRVPGGILFELATEGPGLMVDENTNDETNALGEQLSLPPFLEAQRAEIEAQLKPIVIPEPKHTS